MADLFPIVRPAASGGARNLDENADTLLAGTLDRTTAGVLRVGTSVATTVGIGSATCLVDIDASSVTLDSAGSISIDGVGASNLTIDTGNLTINTTTSGNISLDSIGNIESNADGTNIVHGAGVTIISDGGILNITGDGAADINFSNVGGEIDVDADILTIDTTAGITMDATQDISLDAAWASNFSVTGASLTLSTITSGSLILTGAGLVDINAGANLDIDVTGNFTMDSTGTFSVDGVGASNVTTSTGDLTVSTIVSGSLILTGIALVDINAGANLDIDVTGSTTIDSTTNISLDAATASNFTVSGATADLTLGARGTTITLNELGQTSYSGSATSIIGALNENAAAIANTTLDVAYNNSAGASLVTVDVGDLTFSPTNAFSFIVDLAAITGTADGFFITDGTDNFNLIHKGVNDLDLDADLGEFNIAAASASLITVAGANLSFTTTGSGNIIVNAVDTLDIDAGAASTVDILDALTINTAGQTDIITSKNGITIQATSATAGQIIITTASEDILIQTTGAVAPNGAPGDSVFITSDHGKVDIDGNVSVLIDSAGLISIDAVTTIDWSGTNASLTTAGALAIASDFTLTGGGTIGTTAAGNLTLAPHTTGLIVCSNDTDMNGDFLQTVAATVTSATYTVLTGDATVFINYAGAVTITVPSALIAKTGWTCLFKDISLNASVHNISIVTAGAEEIEGETDALIDVDGAVLELRSDGTDLWDITRR